MSEKGICYNCGTIQIQTYPTEQNQFVCSPECEREIKDSDFSCFLCGTTIGQKQAIKTFFTQGKRYDLCPKHEYFAQDSRKTIFEKETSRETTEKTKKRNNIITGLLAIFIASFLIAVMIATLLLPINNTSNKFIAITTIIIFIPFLILFFIKNHNIYIH